VDLPIEYGDFPKFLRNHQLFFIFFQAAGMLAVGALMAGRIMDTV
jgi:hypothetical protein